MLKKMNKRLSALAYRGHVLLIWPLVFMGARLAGRIVLNLWSMIEQ